MLSSGLVQDRRRVVPWDDMAMKNRLTPEQHRTLQALERDGWELEFVRDERPPVPVALAESGQHAVILPDGSIDQQSSVALRR